MSERKVREWRSTRTLLLGSAAGVTLSMFMATGMVRAQSATVVLDFATPTHSATADIDSVLDQVNTNSISAAASGSTLYVQELVSGSASLSTVATSLIDNSISAGATGNTSDTSVQLDVNPTLADDTVAVGIYQANSGPVAGSSAGDQHVVVIESTTSATGGVVTLTGTVTADNNDISAAATANTADASIDIAGGVSLSGTDAGATAALDQSLLSTDSVTAADLVISSAQISESGATATITGSSFAPFLGTIGVSVQSVSGSTVTLSNSDATATARGNVLTSALSTEDTTSNSVGASMALTSLQSLASGGDVVATTDDVTIGMVTGFAIGDSGATGLTDGSTLSIETNTISAQATGNSSSQILSATANELAGDVSVASLSDASGSAGVQLAASGDALVASVQRQDGAEVTARNVNGNVILATASSGAASVADSTLALTGNAVTSQALGANATNSLTLDANAISASAAVASVQSNTGTVNAATADSTVMVEAFSTVSGSTLTVTGNKQTALAAGLQATNSLILADGSNNLTVASNDGGITVDANAADSASGAPTVTAAFAVANDQLTTGSTTAELSAGGVFIGTFDSVASSTLTNDLNLQSATVYTQTAGNSIDLHFNNLEGGAATSESGAVVAAVANAQTISGGVSTASAVGTGSAPIVTMVMGSLTDGNVSTSSNSISATVVGNRTLANGITVDATNVQVSGAAALLAVNGGEGDIQLSADFATASLQEARDSAFVATQVSGSSSNTISTAIEGVISSSSVASDSNLLAVSATANSAVNANQIGTDSTATVAATSVLANVQLVAGSMVTAELGVEGIDAIAGFSSDNSASGGGGLGGTWNSSTETLTLVSGATLTFDSPLTAEEAAVLNGIFGAAGGGISVGATTITIAAGSYDVTPLDSTVSGITGDTVTIGGFDGDPVTGTPNGAGVIVTSDGAAIFGSAVSVDGNVITGAVTGNTAANTVTATAASVDSNLVADATIALDGYAVVADHSLSNVQQVGDGSPLSSTVYGSFGIDQAVDQTVSGSTLTVDGNTQQATATSNDASNAVAVSGTNVATSAALASNQFASSSVTTTSDVEIFANAGATGSAVSLSNNVNQSLATANSVENEVTLTGTNLSSIRAVASDPSTVSGGVVLADAALYNSQTMASTSGGVVSTATTRVYNADLLDSDPAALSGSTLGMDGNVTTAQATSNIATNVLSVGGADTAGTDATAALMNVQWALLDPTTATASASVGLDLGSDAMLVNAVTDSTATIDGNITTARATGNSSVNQMNVAGANITSGVEGADAFIDSTTASAAFVTSNLQSQGSAVTATSTAVDYTITLATDEDPVSSSTLSLSANQSNAYATGNMASNSVMNLGGAGTSTITATGALNNAQSNTGSVSASASATVLATLDDTDATSGTTALHSSVLNIGDNSVTALARGNVANNTMTVGATTAAGGLGTDASITGTGVSATYAMLNGQANDGDVTATSAGAVFQAVLNQGSTYNGSDALYDSSLSVTGNIVQASGYGNIATNSLTLTSLNGGSDDATVAVSSSQYNTGAITSTVTGARIGSSSLGEVAGAAVTVGGNALSATSVGNYATTAIVRN
ncbi:MAG: beta strand repeat-containing protein [Pseudodonghicola sp.]